MAIQIPNPGTGNGASGDNEFVLWSKVKDNFSDQTNAASRLVGTTTGQIPLYENLKGATVRAINVSATNAGASDANNNYLKGLQYHYGNADVSGVPTLGSTPVSILAYSPNATVFQQYQLLTSGRMILYNDRLCMQAVEYVNGKYQYKQVLTNYYSTANTTKDANGFLKGASPVVDLYNDAIEMNQDAIEQGGITFEKLGVGDYLIKGSLGFAQEGWYIETPKDANGNVLVAVVYEQLPNNDLSIKTYAKKFDDETGDIVANLLKPRDIPTGRFISLRLHELPKEPPVMPTETQTEV